MILVSFYMWYSLRFAQRVTEKQSMKKSNLALCHSDLNCKLVFFNDGLEKEFEWHLCKVHSQWKQAEWKELWEAENVKDPTFKQGIGIREDFDLWEWHFRMIILSGMKKNMDWSDQ